MVTAREMLARIVIGAYRGGTRARSRLFSLSAGPAFASFGARSTIEVPVRLSGEAGIAIGDDVFVGAGCWLQAIADDTGRIGEVVIGDGTNIAGGCVVSAARMIRVGERVLIARNVYISDHAHAFGDPRRAILAQGISQIGAVEIADGAWIGQNVVICPGVRIGRGAVVGANAVVRQDVPDHTVAAGVPARLIRGTGREDAVPGRPEARGRVAP